jgi:hypothetical protein
MWPSVRRVYSSFSAEEDKRDEEEIEYEEEDETEEIEDEEDEEEEGDENWNTNIVNPFSRSTGTIDIDSVLQFADSVIDGERSVKDLGSRKHKTRLTLALHHYNRQAEEGVQMATEANIKCEKLVNLLRQITGE